MRPSDSTRTRGVIVSGFVQTLDQISRVLKLDRRKERRGSVDALDLNTSRVAAASRDAAVPESKAVGIRHSTKEINVLLLHVKIRIVDRNNLRRVRSRSYAQRFDLDVSIKKFGWQVWIGSHNLQRRSLPQSDRARDRYYQYGDG